MDFKQLMETELANLNKKLSTKKKLYDIGVYEDVQGAIGTVVQEDRGKRKESYTFGKSVQNDDDDDDDDDDADDDDDGDGDGDNESDTNEVYGSSQNNDDDDNDYSESDINEVDGSSQNEGKRNLLDIDLREFLNTGATSTEAEKKAALLIEEVPGLEDMPTYFDMNLKRGSGIDESSRTLTSVDKLLQKSIMQPGFEKQHAIPYETSEKRLRLERKKQRERTKGAKWFNMPAPELTDEAKNDLMVLQMRAALDPKHFYKKNDLKVLPKYFQVGKVVDAPEDFYSSRIPKKERKKTIVDELLADAEFKKYNKRRYLEIIAEKKRTHHKAHKHSQRLKRKGKKK